MKSFLDMLVSVLLLFALFLAVTYDPAYSIFANTFGAAVAAVACVTLWRLIDN